jgi:hypothetical protein
VLHRTITGQSASRKEIEPMARMKDAAMRQQETPPANVPAVKQSKTQLAAVPASNPYLEDAGDGIGDM